MKSKNTLSPMSLKIKSNINNFNSPKNEFLQTNYTTQTLSNSKFSQYNKNAKINSILKNVHFNKKNQVSLTEMSPNNFSHKINKTLEHKLNKLINNSPSKKSVKFIDENINNTNNTINNNNDDNNKKIFMMKKKFNQTFSNFNKRCSLTFGGSGAKYIKANELLPTNINSYIHLIKDKEFSIYENLNWTMRLRENSTGKIKDYNDFFISKENNFANEKESSKIRVTTDFHPPSFYDEDLKKFKSKKIFSEKNNTKFNSPFGTKSLKRPLSTYYNPDIFSDSVKTNNENNFNYNIIKHLSTKKNCGHGQINLAQFKFSTSLRNFFTPTHLKTATTSREGDRKWAPPYGKKNLEKFLSEYFEPRTKNGMMTYRNREGLFPKKLEIKRYQNVLVGNDTIKKKIMGKVDGVNFSGAGDTLGDMKYDNIFREVNINSNKKILKLANNDYCKFELGLRLYGPLIRNRVKRPKIKPKEK